ncbi:putative odorant receptor 85d [Glossina fuscipes]|uniref:Odorant receptor 85d n=1 Tax=Glossina fuscipes TaxID=7396 RepID=A0A9C5ZKG6_9MUSC|nr:putative odorant receptor 85d [Glossina fuscipes]
MNFKHLANRIRNLKPSNAEDDIRNLNKLLSYHQDMLFSVDIVNEIFSFSLLINFFAAGALLCLAAVNVIAGSSFYDYIRHTTFLLVALADMYYVCKHADNLMTLSTDISDAFAEHPWYNGSIYYQRMLVFPIARAQRPAALYAYKFFVVSMESFQSLLTSSYQFFTLIKARFDEE